MLQKNPFTLSALDLSIQNIFLIHIISLTYDIAIFLKINKLVCSGSLQWLHISRVLKPSDWQAMVSQHSTLKRALVLSRLNWMKLSQFSWPTF